MTQSENQSPDLGYCSSNESLPCLLGPQPCSTVQEDLNVKSTGWVSSSDIKSCHTFSSSMMRASPAFLM